MVVKQPWELEPILRITLEYFAEEMMGGIGTLNTCYRSQGSSCSEDQSEFKNEPQRGKVATSCRMTHGTGLLQNNLNSAGRVMPSHPFI